MKKYLLALSVILALVFQGCDSNSDDTTPIAGGGDSVVIPAGQIGGTVAVGLPLEADISVVGANGVESTTTSNSDGEYRASLTGLTAPYIVRASTEDGIVLFSFAQTDASITNVTPLTSYILDRVATQGSLAGVSQLYSDFASQSDLISTVDPIVTQLNDALAPYMSAQDVASFDHFRDSFIADHTGYDALLDALDIEIENDDLVIRLDDQVLNTYEDMNITADATVYVTGAVNSILGDPVSGATIKFTSANGDDFNVTSDQEGLYYHEALPSYRVYTVNITADGYLPVTITNFSTFTNTSVSTAVMVPDNMTGSGDVSGTVIDARTGGGLAGATLSFRANINNRTGDVVATATTNTNGEYSVSLPAGIYTVRASLEEYSANYMTVYSFGAADTYEAPALSIFRSLSGYNNANAFATIQLTWGENPSDLDSHLTGPDAILAGSYASEDRFHIAYYDKQHVSDTVSYTDFNTSNPCATEGIIASLDLDDTTSYGPETTTICRVESGVYSFYVHHFSGSSTISASPAVVNVTTASGITRTFTAPIGATGYSSDVWHVFDLSSNGTITSVNQFLSGTSNIRSVSTGHDDSEVFINLPEKK
jgi:hypothetical protein